MRKLTQPLQVLRRQLVAGPDRSRRSHGIEVVEVHEAGGGLVVISANENLSQLPRTLCDLVRTGAVADNVPEVHHRVKRRSGRDTCIQSFQIGVNVAEDQYAHGSPDELPIIDCTEKIGANRSNLPKTRVWISGRLQWYSHRAAGAVGH